MAAVVLYWCLGPQVVAGVVAPVKPGVVMLLAEEPAYRKATEPEVVHEGVLESNPGTGGGRFHPYRLAGEDEQGRPFVLLLYAPGRAHLLAAHVGRRVRLAGKVIEAQKGRGHVELWPARLEAVSSAL